jgi:putative flippase GtrA
MGVQRELFSFALVGTIGFVVDGGALTVLSVVYGLNVYASRLVSFSLATCVTWWLNRMHTFGLPAGQGSVTYAGEYGRYVAVQIVGALLNLAIFAWLIRLNPNLRQIPVLPLAVGAGAGLVWNYLGARLWVYRKSVRQ